MADKINLLIESMMPDMLYWFRRKIFSKEEGKAILKNREDLEYSLAKTTVKIHNYLKAIQFEYDLVNNLDRAKNIRIFIFLGKKKKRKQSCFKL